MTQNFKKMRCIDNRWTNGRLTLDKVYEVGHIHGSEFVRVYDDTADCVVVMIQRFEEVKQ